MAELKPLENLLIKEFEKWQEETSSEAIFFLEVCHKHKPLERNSSLCMPNEKNAIADKLCNVVKHDHDHIFCSMGSVRVERQYRILTKKHRHKDTKICYIFI